MWLTNWARDDDITLAVVWEFADGSGHDGTVGLGEADEMA